VARIVFIGSEATAAGFRLAGVDTRVATTGDAALQLRRARAEPNDCVLLEGTLLDGVPIAELQSALLADTPALLVIPDVMGRGAPPDLAHEVRLALGIET
jgi:vacuolar-type H+-ATPase subunit F/Vma7